jgi:hypothetical protein
MDDWIDRLADALGVEPPSAAETSDILSAARDVAHRVERRITPVSTYLLGVAVGGRVAGGAWRPDALRDALAELGPILPDRPAEPEA